MKRLRSILLATTMLVGLAQPAHGAPVVGFLAGAGAALFGSAPLVLSGVAASTSAYAAGAFAVQAVLGFAGSALGGILVNAALGFALNTFLTQGIDAPRPTPQDLQANFMLADQPRFWCAGPNRIGGGITWAEAKDGRLYKQVAHCDTEATSEIGLYLNDIQVTLDGSNAVEQDDFTVNGAPFVKIHRRPGTANQAAQSVLTNAFPEWTTGHIGAGVSDTLMTIEPVGQEARQKIYKHRGVLGLGEPDLTRVALFGRCHDPRNVNSVAENPATWPACTGNPALIWAAHRMQAERFAFSAGDINWNSVAAAADVCDLPIVDRYGSSAPQYQCGIAVNKVNETNLQAEDRILASFDGMRFEDDQGRIGIIAGSYIEPDVTLTDEDVFDIESGEGDDGENTFTHFHAEYTEPAYGYKSQPSAQWVHPDWSQGDRVKSTSISVIPAINHRQAVQLVQVAGMRQRERRRLGVVAGLRARRLKERRTVRLDLQSDPELSGVYEIAGFKREQGQFFVALVLIRLSGDWWTLAPGAEGERPNLNVTVANDVSLTNIAPENMVITAAQIQATGGESVARFVAAFPEPGRVDRLVQIQIRLKGSTAWEEMSVRSEDGAAASGVVSDGATYEIRWRVVSLSGDVSEWSNIVEKVAVADAIPPGPLQSFAVSSPSAGTVDVTMTTPVSGNFFATRIYRADYAPGYGGPYEFASAVQVRDEVGFPGQADSWTDSGLSAGHYAYWADTLNGSGQFNANNRSGPRTVNVA